MDDDARQCARTYFFHEIRRFVDDETTYTLVRTLILSLLDYCNSLYWLYVRY